MKRIQYDLIVVTMEPFPYGMAATNRILSYLKGIAKNSRVLLLTFGGPVQGPSLNINSFGRYCEIDYKYFCNPCVDKLPNIFVRALRAIWRRIKLIYCLVFKFSYTSILLYTTDIPILIILRIITWINCSKIYSDKTELNLSTISGQLIKRVFRSYDGIIVISDAMNNIFDNIVPQKKFLLPVLVDADRFNFSSLSNKYFFFCSGGNVERDGLLDILKSFLIFCSKRHGYTLVIATSFNIKDPYHIACKKIIDTNKDVIQFLGNISSVEIPKWMCSAKALLITPHKKYKTFGFPTKLGEYLASGVPTICSTIEDFSGIVTDNIAFLVDPNSPQQIAEQLINIISDEKHAFEIANNAKSFIFANFSIDRYQKALLSFLSL